MSLFRIGLATAAGALAGLLATGVASAQTSPSPSPPASPAPSARHNLITEQYDGKTHINLTPYVWLPSVNGYFAYAIPVKLPPPYAGKTIEFTAEASPGSYLSHLNFAAMGTFDIRKGDVAVFGDLINANLTKGSTYSTSLAIPEFKTTVPITVDNSTHLSSTIYEVAGAYTLAEGPSASVEAFVGWRQTSIGANLGWNLALGSKPPIYRAGTVHSGDNFGDFITGLRGTIALGDGGWFIPYYGDFGTGAPQNTSWQAYAGIGKSFRNGSLIVAFRQLNYDLPPGVSYVQKLGLGGPLVGYTFRLSP
jgi:hypothetical protein